MSAWLAGVTFVCDWEAVDAMVSLAVLTDIERERWYDHRILGLSREQIGARDGVTASAVWITVDKADRKLAAARHHAPREAIAA